MDTDWSQLIGRFHPLLVHLPIGILLLALTFDMLSRWQRFAYLRPSIRLTYFLGAVTALMTCGTGYLLSTSGEYDANTVSWHQWMGIGVAALSAGIWWSKTKPTFATQPVLQNGLPILLGIVLLIAGHLGGNLTHGSDYLVQHLPSSIKGWLGVETEVKRIVIVDVQQAAIYDEVIAPILQYKCYKCHGSTKKKGKLRLDTPEHIQQGGKSGEPIVVAGQPDQSELIKRISLPIHEEDHMPPEEKPQLTAAEIDLLRWWIEVGAPFTGTIADLPQTEAIQAKLTELEGEVAVPTTEKYTPTVAAVYPQVSVPAPDMNAVQQLRALDVVVLPLGQDDHRIRVNFINVAPTNLTEAIQALRPLAKNVVWLSWSNQALPDTAFQLLTEMENLSKLYLEDTGITDQDLVHLRPLQALRYLNLVGNPITADGLANLSDLPQLTQLFLFRTEVQREDYAALVQLFPEVEVDTGGYRFVPVGEVEEGGGVEGVRE